jgi:Putative adhesin
VPTFATPHPITATIEVIHGDIRIVAADRLDTVVEIQPSDPAKPSDSAAAKETRVEYANGKLHVKTPKGWRQWTIRREHESVQVQIEIPAGSQIDASTGLASLWCTGRIGECRIRGGVGDVHLEQTGPLEIRSGIGDVTVDVVNGKAEITTSGAVSLGQVDGPVMVKNRRGDTWIGEIAGESRLTAASGSISADHPQAGVAAKTASGDIRLGDIVRGPINVQSAFGAVDIGIRDGAQAWLDLETKFGRLKNDMEAAAGPGQGQDTVEVTARTTMGDIAVRRSQPAVAP